VLEDSARQDSDRSVALIVLEQGASWPVWLADRGREAGSVVVAQSPLESESDFAQRVLRRVASVQADSDEELTRAFLVCNGSDDPERNTARIHVARAVIAVMSEGEDGELVLTACRTAGSGRASHQLLALAGVLCEGLQGSRVTVRVRVDEPTAESGVRRTAPVSAPPSAAAAK
jgi:hypothetical protein